MIRSYIVYITVNYNLGYICSERVYGVPFGYIGGIIHFTEQHLPPFRVM